MPPEFDPNIIEFRLSTVEQKLDESLGQISAKLDALLVAVSKYQTEQALFQERLDTLKDRVAKLEIANEALREGQTGLRITLAERVGPGAIAGAISAILVVALKFIVGI